MKTIPLILLAITGADFQMLQEPLQDEVSYHMLAGPPEREDRRDRSVQGPDNEEAAVASDAQAARSPRLLVYTASWCRPRHGAPSACRRFREEVLPKLEAAGWEVGNEPTNHIQLIAVGETPPEGIESLPTFVLVEDGREVRRHVGVLDAWGVGELVKGYSERPEPILSRRGATLSGTIPLSITQSALAPPLRQRCRRCGRFHAFGGWR